MSDVSAPKSYKVGVRVAGSTSWDSNLMRFATEDQARAYGLRLADRWTRVTEWTVLHSDDEPNA